MRKLLFTTQAESPVPVLLIFFLCIVLQVQASPTCFTSDLVWNYESAEFDFYHGQQYIYASHNGYYFEGVEIFDGITYSVFRQADGTPYAYMRQDGPRVYVRNNQGRVQICNVDLTLPPDDEYQLYDFSKQPGEPFCTVAFMEVSLMYKCYGYGLNAIVIDTYTKEINGREYLYQEYELINGEPSSFPPGDPYCRNTVIEGIGPQRGMLCAPQLGWWIVSISHEFWYTSSVTTKEGEILWDDSSGIETVVADTTPSAGSTIYDLHGRLVVNPLPGTIYVRDGKKFVAR